MHPFKSYDAFSSITDCEKALLAWKLYHEFGLRDLKYFSFERRNFENASKNTTWNMHPRSFDRSI